MAAICPVSQTRACRPLKAIEAQARGAAPGLRDDPLGLSRPRAEVRGCQDWRVDIAAFIALFIAVVATWIAVSGPGEAALVSAGAIAARGEEEITAVLAIAFAGTVAGSVLAYWLGRTGGRRLLLRSGPLLAWRARALTRSEAIAQRRALLASLLVPGWLAGVNAISPRPFIAGAALSGLAWTLTIGLGTFLVGPSLISVYDDIGSWVTIGLMVAAATAALLLLMRRARGRRIAARRGVPRGSATGRVDQTAALSSGAVRSKRATLRRRGRRGLDEARGGPKVAESPKLDAETLCPL